MNARWGGGHGRVVNVAKLATAVAVAAVLVGVPTASGTPKSYAGEPQLDTSLSMEEFRQGVHAWCARQRPEWAGLTPGALVFDRGRTRAVLMAGTPDAFGHCSFSPNGSGVGLAPTSRAGLATGKPLHSVGSGFGTDADNGPPEFRAVGPGTYGIGMRVALGVTSVTVHLADGQVVAAVVDGETAALIVSPFTSDDFGTARVVLQDASGAVVYDGPL
ncbi:MAG: hypothetical protein ABIQ18_29575 [Umezawaea sp.]